ncbi:hypothetical protein G6K88_14200 [Agrobacterium rhizogenes]|uniref:hypothetical protein n=1 Tax=Rhizobium rhizogenes TaxID=359 RepID=UPI00115EF8E5|nr:hypothetical protein [Rhizobium rhizogenes]NTI03172.1 hypothetical protein [Rhizobium rhizogenes]NTI09976.1 hypothetical protein [Rhizobium rhizogenes]TRB21501.1 hypothetical protein EXN70_21580 [Rhizobium rhizogenes]
MSNMFTSKNPAGVAVAQTSAIFGVLAAGAVNAHMSGIQAMRQARESNNSHQLRYQLGHAINYCQSVMDIAVAQATEIERLKAENARLRTASATYLAAARRKAVA